MAVSAEDFVRVWQTSASVAEVCARTGIAETWRASARASDYRRRGVKLKRMPRKDSTTEDWGMLAALATELETTRGK